MIIHRVIQKLERGYFTRHTVCLNYEHIKMQLRKTNKTNQSTNHLNIHHDHERNFVHRSVSLTQKRNKNRHTNKHPAARVKENNAKVTSS